MAQCIAHRFVKEDRDDHQKKLGKLQAPLDQTKVKMGQQSKDFEARLAQKEAETEVEKAKPRPGPRRSKRPKARKRT